MQKIAPGISCAKSEDFLQVEAANESVDMRRLHGLYHGLIQNMGYLTRSKNTLIAITGIVRQAVGQFSAEIRPLRPPEPYQGNGIRYRGEFVLRKAEKAAKSAKK
ncbi:hypothetical protein ACTFIW_012109 [Dictyostelium discoideum]